MNCPSPARIVVALLLCVSIGMAGCARAPSEAPVAPAPVMVSHPALRDVTDYADFTARTAAVDSVEVRAHVWGYLDKVNFKEGAPVSGRVSRYVVTVGNLIQSGDQGGGTVLTTIVSVDPMYAYFDVDERTVLRVHQLIREGKAKSARDVELPVRLGLANEDEYPHRGTINFVDNQVSPKTGTLRVRGVFPNKDEALAPGYFARVRVPIGFPHQALLVSERALDNDQGQKILYVVNEKSEVISRPAHLGSLHDGLREITEGLKSGEQIVVKGLQQVRPDVTVEPNLVDMPGQNPKSQAPN